MRWPWAHEPRRQHYEDKGHGMDDAQHALDEAMSQWPEVKKASENMKQIRGRNHLAETVDAALKGHR